MRGVGKFPCAILSARKIAGYTQRELADQIGVHENSIAKWETGKVSPDVYKLGALCAALGVSPNEVLGFDELAEVENLKNEVYFLKRRISNAKHALA